MKPLLQEAFLILALGLVLIAAAKPKQEIADDYYYEDVDDSVIKQNGNILADSDKPCPRDCLCTSSPDTRIARCSRLEIGTQIFGDDITGLEVTNLDRKHPLILTDMMFYKMGLHKLTNVKLTNNVMTMLELTAFAGLKNLLSANLTNNHIEEIDLNMFESNVNLALVDFSDNPLVISKYDRPILNSSSIQELEMARCGITTLHKKAFSLLKNIMYINLAGNKLQNIDPLLFTNLIALEEVDLSDNYIREIPENLFVGNPNITTLTLRGNPLTSVVGVEIKELLTIDLSLTNINAVGPSMFSGMTILSNVNLSGCGISKIHNQVFHQLTFLNYLDLSDNNLDMISDRLIEKNLDLDIFKIARNPLLSKLPKDGFVCANSTFSTYLFDASGCSIEELHDNTFKTMTTLSQLLLGNNEITTIGKALYNCPKLINIDLSNNLITTLDKDTFSRNSELGKLNLAGNRIGTLNPELFINNPNLAWLDVTSCGLTSLWSLDSLAPYSIMNNLHFINASYNDIKVIKKKELDIINKLFILDITDNPLECNLDFEVLMTWLDKHHVSPGNRELSLPDTIITENTSGKREKWEALAKTVCKTEPVKPIVIKSNQIPIDNKNDKPKTVKKQKDFSYIDKVDEDDDDDDYDSDSDEDNYDDTDDEDIYDDSYIDNKVNKKKVDELKKNVEKTEKEEEASKKLEINEEMIKIVSKISENIDPKKIDIPLVDEYMKDFEETEEELAYLEEERHYTTVIVPLKITGFIIAIVLIILAVLKLSIRCMHKEHRNRIKCAIISLHPNNGEGRVKKDCGIIYQQLSEDLTGPKTPIITRHLLGVSDKNKLATYQVAPFPNSKITPEHV